MRIRKGIIDFITATGMTTKDAIVTDCCNTLAVRPRRVIRVLDLMVAGGRIAKNGNDYTIA